MNHSSPFIRLTPCLLPLLLAACSLPAIPTINPTAALLRPDAEITILLPNSTVTFTIAQTPENISNYAHSLFSSGYYRGQYIYRQVPGLCMATGIATLSGWRNAQSFKLPTEETKNGPQPIKTKPTGPGTVGLLRHPNGTIGPELVIHYGRNPLETCPLQATQIGKITQGRSTLHRTLKGDKIRQTQLKF